MTKSKEKALKNRLNEQIIRSISDKKGNDILTIDLQAFDNSITDFFIIADATSNVQVKAIADHVQRQVSKVLKTKPLGVEGEENAEWILIDYGETIVHIFQRPVREYYDLESLWADAPHIKQDQE